MHLPFLLLSIGLSMPAMAAPPYWTLVWADEFDGPASAPPDPTKWVFETGAGGWGNQELETYTDSRDNSRLDGNVGRSLKREECGGVSYLRRNDGGLADAERRVPVERFHNRKQQPHRQSEDHHRPQHEFQEPGIGDDQITLRPQDQPGLVHEQPEFEQVRLGDALGPAYGGLVRRVAEDQQYADTGEDTDGNQARECRHAEIDRAHSK